MVPYINNDFDNTTITFNSQDEIMKEKYVHELEKLCMSIEDKNIRDRFIKLYDDRYGRYLKSEKKK